MIRKDFIFGRLFKILVVLLKIWLIFLMISGVTFKIKIDYFRSLESKLFKVGVTFYHDFLILVHF